MGGWTAGRTQTRHDPGFFVRGGVQARRPEYRIRTWDQYVRTRTHTRTRAHARTRAHTHTHAHTHMYRQTHEADGWTYMYMYRRQTKRQFI